MAETDDPARRPNLIRAADHADLGGFRWEFSHPLNPASQVAGLALSRAAGLQRTAVNLYRVPPGRESFAYHAHAAEEEWIYVLAGRGVAEIDGGEHPVGPGDFMAFPTPSVAHHLRNPFDDELVYLAGGEHREVEVAEFPRHGKRLVRVGDRIALHDAAGAAPLGDFAALQVPR